MAEVTFTIEPDELLGLNALVELAEAADDGPGAAADAVSDCSCCPRR